MTTPIQYPEIGSKYRHYKGGSYQVITMATHSETGEAMVVYESLLFGSVHVRPLSMWFNPVQTTIEGTDITISTTRFSKTY